MLLCLPTIASKKGIVIFINNTNTMPLLVAVFSRTRALLSISLGGFVALTVSSLSGFGGNIDL
jgi:hypothetical protein